MGVYEDTSMQGKLPWKQNKWRFRQDYVLNLLLKGFYAVKKKKRRVFLSRLCFKETLL